MVNEACESSGQNENPIYIPGSAMHSSWYEKYKYEDDSITFNPTFNIFRRPESGEGPLGVRSRRTANGSHYFRLVYHEVRRL